MSNFSDPQSRNEAIIQNILGASNVLEDPQSRVETILQAILNNSSYTAEAKSRIEEILIAILNGQSYNKTTYSRNEAILKAIANGGTYTEQARSRMETLLLQWLEASGDVEKTVTGNLITITDAKAEPAVALSAAINFKQSGSGDPSPSNIRPITGWTEVNASVAGKNLFNYNNVLPLTTMSNTSGVFSNTVTDSKTMFEWTVQAWNENTYVALTPTQNISRSGKYSATITINSPVTHLRIKHNGSRKDFVLMYPFTAQGTFTISIDVTSADPTTIGGVSFKDVQIELGSTATTYEAYAGQDYEVQLGQTVYGGTLDVVSGELTITHGYIASYNGESLPGEWISDRDVYAQGTTPTTGAEVVYEVASPTTVQLTGQQVTLLAGTNNIWADTNGNLTLTYKARE